jgi:two-component system cell cycle sensor histidine kinase/response regulator CckA
MMHLHMPLRRPEHASAMESSSGVELSGLFEARSELAAVLDAKGTVLCTGPHASELFGLPLRELSGAGALSLIHPEDAAAFESQFRKALEGAGEPCPVEWRTRTADGAWRALAGSIRALRTGDEVSCVALTAQDAADRRQAERQLRRAQRMAALGELTGGVAHEFSNLLSVILCYNELALGAEEGDGTLRSDLEEMHIAAERGAALVAQLLSYGRRNGGAHRSADLNHIVDDMVRMLSPVLDDRIRIFAELAPDLHMVRVDPAQFEQVLLNLALNARDAMPYGGVIRITTRNADSNGRAREGAAPGQYAHLSFSDTGAGMDAETRGRIFEPFFTTKPGGHGAGLGLATVRSIVHQHGGSIVVESEVDRGTTFHIYIPKAESAPGLRP